MLVPRTSRSQGRQSVFVDQAEDDVVAAPRLRGGISVGSPCCDLAAAISHAIALDSHIVAYATSIGELQVTASDDTFGTHKSAQTLHIGPKEHPPVEFCRQRARCSTLFVAQVIVERTCSAMPVDTFGTQTLGRGLTTDRALAAVWHYVPWRAGDKSAKVPRSDRGGGALLAPFGMLVRAEGGRTGTTIVTRTVDDEAAALASRCALRHPRCVDDGEPQL